MQFIFSNHLLDSERREHLNPNFSLAQGYYGLALSFCGRWKDANEATYRALRLSPRDPFSAIYYGVASYIQFVGYNYDEAIRLARSPSQRFCQRPPLTAAAGMTGQHDVAKAALQELRRVQPNISLKWISSFTPIKLDASGSTIWKPSAVPVWTSMASD